MKQLYYKPCDFCEEPDQPFEFKGDALCINCSVEFNDGMVARYTEPNGNCTKPYFLKRRWHLRELLNQVSIPRSDGLERENVTCQRCGKMFVALKLNHLKYCGDCTHWKQQMDDLRLSRKYE